MPSNYVPVQTSLNTCFSEGRESKAWSSEVVCGYINFRIYAILHLFQIICLQGYEEEVLTIRELVRQCLLLLKRAILY